MRGSARPLGLAALTVLLSVSVLAQRIADQPYPQPVSHRFTLSGQPRVAQWPQLPIKSVTQIIAADPSARPTSPFANLFFVSDANGTVWTFNGATASANHLALTWSGINVPAQQILFDPSTLTLYIVSGARVATCVSQGSPEQFSCTSFAAAALGQTNALALDSSKTLWVASNGGLYYFKKGSQTANRISYIRETPVISVAIDSTGQVAAGSPNFVSCSINLLWRQVMIPGLSEPKWHFFHTPGLIDAAPVALSFDSSDDLWVGNNICVNVQYKNLTVQRISGYQGLPFSNITSSGYHFAQGSIWFGSDLGVMRYNPKLPEPVSSWAGYEWRYFLGPRWIPSMKATEGNGIITMAVSTVNGNECALVANDFPGMALICIETWTLRKKAQVIQNNADLPVFSRHNLVADVNLAAFGDLSTGKATHGDNDGLWTSIYLASQSFRYAATKDEQARQNAIKAFSGMEFLNLITGVKGLMARSVVHTSEPAKFNQFPWHQNPAYPGWVWEDDTSSDEVSGHMSVYPIFYDLVAQTSSEKSRALNLAVDIVRGIQSNDWYLVDASGNRTKWGVWNPHQLNEQEFWYDERGVNSLQILCWLTAAHRLTGDSYFMDGMNELRQKHQYDLNIINAKIMQATDINFSDDELTYLPYMDYIWAALQSGETPLGVFFDLSIERTMINVAEVRGSLWNFIYALYRQKVSKNTEPISPSFINDAVWTLQTWPVEQIDWPTDNRLRLDVQWDASVDRFFKANLRTLVPYDENNMFKWNGDPFAPSGGRGYSADCGAAFLYPFWLGYYLNYI